MERSTGSEGISSHFSSSGKSQGGGPLVNEGVPQGARLSKDFPTPITLALVKILIR